METYPNEPFKEPNSKRRLEIPASISFSSPGPCESALELTFSGGSNLSDVESSRPCSVVPESVRLAAEVGSSPSSVCFKIAGCDFVPLGFFVLFCLVSLLSPCSLRLDCFCEGPFAFAGISVALATEKGRNINN